MKLRVIEVLDAGYLHAERIVLAANRRCETDRFCLTTCLELRGKSVALQQPSVMRLPKDFLQVGDRLVVWTRRMKPFAEFDEWDSRTQHISWGLRRPLFEFENTGVLVQEILGEPVFRSN
ncbi:hypothetical protein [Agrobacterium larrymoorei]|uniref:Uncharacterized protein n=1 Tax=Agrobacterium larrymoorei TaxID=160699 RepID=A0A4D7DXW8_9HYPH|nr:hypothetical protein [Agrobacterium larrymoorei]QCJ00075.1 hypothetical protein CFBP5473_19250 [Agrobacterium larrymoorei]QYA09483.1 hypothetical protein J5285_19100 [Agrobacterium larrymoorei]